MLRMWVLTVLTETDSDRDIDEEDPSPGGSGDEVAAAERPGGDSDTAQASTPQTLGVSMLLGFCGARVLCRPWCLFLDGVRAWILPACRGGRRAVPRSAASRGGAVPPSWRVRVAAGGLGESGSEHLDLGFPGDGLLGGGGMPEFRAGFLGAC